MDDISLEYFEYPDAMFGGACVYVIEDEESGTLLRVLEVGGGIQSAAYVDERRFEPVFQYYRALDIMFDYEQDCHQGKYGEKACDFNVNCVLMLGGGGCSYPNYALSTHPNLAMDVVEIDPVIIDIARKHFYVDELQERFNAQDRLRLIAEDGRAYVESCAQAQKDPQVLPQADGLVDLDPKAVPAEATSAYSYDVIVNDAFSGKQAVDPLVSPEGLRAIQAILHPRGLYIVNVSSTEDGTNTQAVDEVATALRQTFATVRIIPCIDESFAGEDNYLVIGINELQ